MDPISIEKIRAMKKYSKSRRQQQLLPTLTHYMVMVATFVLCLLLTSPVWFPRLCALLSFFFLTTLPDLATAFLLSPKCLFVVGNLIVAFLVGESRLASRSEPASQVNDIHEERVKRNTATSAKATTAVVVVDHNALVNDIHEEHVQRNNATSAKATTAVVVVDHNALVGGVGEEEEEGEEEELHKRVEDFIARVKKQRRLEAKSFFDTDR